MGTKVSPQTLAFVREVGCSKDCDNIIEINQGIPLPCKEWNNIESNLLRERMLVDNQLMNSGFVRRVDRSVLGDSLRIRQTGLDVGPIKTQDSGAPAVNECKVTFETIRIKDFEKQFYVVNTTKDLQICIKDFIGTKWQDLISDTHADYNADDFADTDLAEIIVSNIIEKYTEFIPKFMLLAVSGGSGEDLHGDDGIFAKAYYASQGQFFHTLSFDLSDVETDFDNTFIQAIVGGDVYDESPKDFASDEEYMMNFLEWVNTRQENRTDLFNASLDLTENKMIVASQFATRFVDLRIVLNDGTLVDWGCKSTMVDELTPDELERAMLINDTPLIFQYENIDSNNFVEKFKDYKKEFKRYLHRNGWADITDADLRIGIDPELMLERTSQIEDRFLAGSIPVNFMDQIGMQASQFVPLNALNDTGLFFMTINGNLLLLSDGSNIMNEITNMGRIRFQEACETPGMVNIYGGAPPIGSEVEAWGAFACNIGDSWFVKNNKLDERGPTESALKNLVCYDYDVKNHCVVEAKCTLSCNVEVEAVYDGGADETTVTVTVNTNTPAGTTLVYDLAYSLSDGTGQTGITSGSFQFTLPGDQTDSGLVVAVTGDIEAQIASEVQCSTNVAYTTKLGEGSGFVLCALNDTNDNATNSVTSQLSVSYQIDGVAQNVALANTALDYGDTADHAAIETEIEGIFPGATVDITNPSASNIAIVITDLPSYITDVTIDSAASGNTTATLAQDC